MKARRLRSARTAYRWLRRQPRAGRDVYLVLRSPVFDHPYEVNGPEEFVDAVWAFDVLCKSIGGYLGRLEMRTARWYGREQGRGRPGRVPPWARHDRPEGLELAARLASLCRVASRCGIDLTVEAER